MRKYGPAALVVAFLFGVWELAARLKNLPFIFPPPSGVAVRLWELRETLLLDHLPSTLAIILIGLAISIVLGVALAVWMAVSETAERAFYPLVISSQMIPTIALAPIFIMFFGYGIWSKVIVTVLITFFPITVNTFDGLKSSSKELRELILTMGGTKKDIFLKVQVPSAKPHFYSGLKVAVTLSVIGAAIGEWLGAQAGLGYFSRRMMNQFDGAAVFAPIVLLSVVGIVLFLVVKGLEKRSLNWRNKK
ncbi:ABC transporter permease [Domibacillus indicus]|uniref:ABC transporter permease n=1 Tax=Domibacillus indicus TaxID=1437523 RepID=UPI00061827BA|nr:ABC transporter permease [Domibacillus indicus]